MRRAESSGDAHQQPVAAKIRAMLSVASMAVGALLVAGTVLAVWRHDAWWVRAWDFPRAQILVLGLLVLIVGAFLGSWSSLSGRVIAALLVLGLLLQAWRIWPYTPLKATQSERITTPTPGANLSILVSNVLMDNRESERLIELVREVDPDLFFAAETDARWIRELDVLGDIFPHAVRVPQPDTYGMVLYSKVELVEPRVEYLMTDDVPSIHAALELPVGRIVHLHLLHPKPPSPTESLETTERDAEILIIGRHVRQRDLPAIVAGDLNDVAWSHTTRLFQRISGMLDPRVGRGLYSTFHAQIPVLRWPLDHVFHTAHFQLVDLKRLRDVGSDHFPIYAHLSLEPQGPIEQDTPEPHPGDLEEAEEKIEAGIEEDGRNGNGG